MGQDVKLVWGLSRIIFNKNNLAKLMVYIVEKVEDSITLTTKMYLDQFGPDHTHRGVSGLQPWAEEG